MPFFSEILNYLWCGFIIIFTKNNFIDMASTCGFQFKVYLSQFYSQDNSHSFMCVRKKQKFDFLFYIFCFSPSSSSGILDPILALVQLQAIRSKKYKLVLQQNAWCGTI